VTKEGRTADQAARQRSARNSVQRKAGTEQPRAHRSTAGVPPAPTGRSTGPTRGELQAAGGVPHAAWLLRLSQPMGQRMGPEWVLAPLRLFLGVTFVYAGIQKLTDPQFFRPTAPGYIGRQIQSFAHGSPISGLLLHLALPHASFFGALIAYGEMAIGVGTLAGLLARPAACGGLLLSLIFFLSASWRVYPYFYGADIVFVFAWISLGLAPHAGLPSLDAELARRLEETGQWDTSRRRLALALALSAPIQPAGMAVEGSGHASRLGGVRVTPPRRGGRTYLQQQSRRSFLTGLASGVVGVVGVTWLWALFHPQTSAPSSSPTGGGTSAGGTPATGGTVIAKASDVPINSAATFTIPSNGDPGVVVHLQSGQFVAFDATCTHAGCPVQYDSGSKDLTCPCHGAVFDPANKAAVLQGPADTPLAAVQVSVNANGDIVLTGS
jgi:thiosulfate dehydrogenase (quinone) large subunit